MQKGWTVLAERVLDFCKMCDLQIWDTQHALTQFNTIAKPVSISFFYIQIASFVLIPPDQ